MIVILKPNVSEARRDQLISWFKAQNLGVHISQGDYQTVLDSSATRNPSTWT